MELSEDPDEETFRKLEFLSLLFREKETLFFFSCFRVFMPLSNKLCTYSAYGQVLVDRWEDSWDMCM